MQEARTYNAEMIQTPEITRHDAVASVHMYASEPSDQWSCSMWPDTADKERETIAGRESVTKCDDGQRAK